MMNAMLVSSSTPHNLWGEAVLISRFLQNRIPHKKIGKTPYELWKDYLSNLKYLKVLACLAKVMLTNPKRKKIVSKTPDCLFISYVEYVASLIVDLSAALTLRHFTQLLVGQNPPPLKTLYR